MKQAAGAALGLMITPGSQAGKTGADIHVQLWRNATLLLHMGGNRFLVDPMLSEKGAMEPVANAGNAIRIPMVDLPLSAAQVQQVISRVDAILITHTHRDHWDDAARELVPKDKPIICPRFEAEKLRVQGFVQVIPAEEVSLPGLRLFQTGGRHGSGATAERMGPVAGFVLEHKGKTVYIAGDTVYCPEVEAAIRQHNPDVLVVNAGGAQFLSGGPIIMNEQDVEQVLQLANRASVVCVHMEAVNHCRTTREGLRRHFERQREKVGRLLIPRDGEWMHLG